MCVLFPGVEDEKAFAPELSRQEGKPSHSPQKPQNQNRSPAGSDTHRPSPFSAAPHRSFSSTPFYHYGAATGSEADEEDEDLQMALACSLSEMEAQQRAAATDCISGARGGGRAMSDKAGGHKESGVVKTAKLNVAGNGKIVAGEKDEVGSGPTDRWERKGQGVVEQSCSTESPTTSSSTPLSSEQGFESAMKNHDGRVKKKNKCGCIVC